MKKFIYSFLFLLGLGIVIAKTPKSYPLKLVQESSIGNKWGGHVRIAHRVILGKNGLYRYEFKFTQFSQKLFRLRWDVLDVPGNTVTNEIEIPYGGARMSYENKYAPIWKMSLVTLEYFDSAWIKVGTWRQSGPVPQNIRLPNGDKSKGP